MENRRYTQEMLDAALEEYRAALAAVHATPPPVPENETPAQEQERLREQRNTQSRWREAWMKVITIERALNGTDPNRRGSGK